MKYDKENEIISDYNDGDKDVNPFLVTATFKVLKGVSSKELLDEGSFDKVDDMHVPKGGIRKGSVEYEYFFEQEKMCRVFQYHAKNVLKDLELQAVKLFLYLICHVSPNAQRIKIDEKKYMKQCGIKSLKTLYTAVNALKSKGVLIKSKPSVYWINPAIFFNGDRIKNFPDNLVVVGIAKRKDDGAV